ncbi:MAG TPA: tetratricopeptide repeat-containing protein, partial [Longimicrobiales bacterium]|nr:tetratricopeptide repeat-containing protein [Longimicrobiales bacterium]
MLETALDEHDDERVKELCRTLAADIRLGATEVPERTGQKLLGLLKANLCFEDLATLGAALSRAHPEHHRIRRLYAQGLIDSGQLDQALDLLQGVVGHPEVSGDELLEAWGLTGRVHKQSYVDSPAEAETKARWLQAAVDAYSRGWSGDVRSPYHGINIVALLARAERDGISLETDHDLSSLAAEILDGVENRIDDGAAGLWDYVIGMEAALALGESDEAVRWAERYVEKGLAAKKGEFEFASTLRQLQEVWAVDPDSPFGSAVLPMLEAVVPDKGLRSEDGSGSVQVDTRAISQMASPETSRRLERVFGDDSFVTTRWLTMLGKRLDAIGCVTTLTGKGIGTGFLVPGSKLSAHLEDGWYFVTNCHVVTDDEEWIAEAPANEKPSRPDEVEVSFEILFSEGPPAFKIAEVVWTSRPHELDVSVLRLEGPVYEGRIEPYPAKRDLADPGTRPRLY